ncbi:hypothetical protein SBY92_003822 [Candida maltosa Xu316]|uniref:Uncharacterized protein n=1 Tax=Candida maltosa (strain Xu316) TaxID=1245528 RepID=M3HM26_CANMX|nr:hypothetical protein G210_0935 [Candida maltosa Xu316]
MFRSRSIQVLSRSARSPLSSSKIIGFNSRRFLSGDLSAGTRGQPIWPSTSVFIKTFAKEGKKMFGWFLALSAILFIWPAGIVDASNAIDHVPKDKGTQVQLHREGLDKFDATVEIPKTYVSLDKEDEDEGVDVDEDDV